MLQPKCEWNHERNTVVLPDNSHCKGITDLLRYHFYPYYNPYAARCSASSSCIAYKAKSSSGLYGNELGKRLDHELAHGKNDLQETRRVLAYFDEHGLAIVGCQFPLADVKTKLCTCLDVLVYNKQENTYVVVEVKTGYYGYKEQHVQMMQPPCHEYTDSVFNQHQLQLLISNRLFTLSFPKIKCGRPLLLYAYEDEVVVHSIDEGLLALQEDVYRMISRSEHNNRRSVFNLNKNKRNTKRIT